MTDRVEPSPNKANKVYATSAALKWAGIVDGWIAPTTDAYVASVEGLTGAPLNAFDITTSGLTVTVDTGEGFVEGRWLARDVTTDVTVSDGTADQTIYVGWAYGSPDTVKIGLSGAFATNDGKVPIWDVTTSGGSVTSQTDRRVLGPPLSESGGSIVLNALSEINSDVTLNASITTTDTGYAGAPVKIRDITAYAHYTGWATIYNNSGNGWRFRDSSSGDTFTVASDGSARFPQGDVELAIENRTTRPSGTRAGRIIYRTDKE